MGKTILEVGHLILVDLSDEEDEKIFLIVEILDDHYAAGIEVKEGMTINSKRKIFKIKEIEFFKEEPADELLSELLIYEAKTKRR